MLSEKEIQKFTELNDKIRQEEICARKLYLELLPKLNEMVEDKLISDYEIDEELALFSFNKDFCKSKNIEVGDSFSSKNTPILFNPMMIFSAPIGTSLIGQILDS